MFINLGMYATSDLLGWHLRKAATSKANVRMVVASITSLSSGACAEVYIIWEAFACLSIYLENESVGSHQCEDCLSRCEIGWCCHLFSCYKCGCLDCLIAFSSLFLICIRSELPIYRYRVV